MVVSIIALLVAILMPALGKAREQGRRAVCVSNLKSLGTVWMMYADDNGGRLASGRTTTLSVLSSSPPEFGIVPSVNSYNEPERPWAAYYALSAGSFTEFDEKAMKACLDLGSLWRYNKSYDIYRCPAGKPHETRTYSIVDAMNGHWDFTAQPNYRVDMTSTRIDRIRRAGERLVFIDEGYASTTSWTIHPTLVQWWDGLPVRHNNGCTGSYANGHAEYWKWEDPRTIAYFSASGASGLDNQTAAQNNADFKKMQRECWGRYVGGD